MKERIRVPKFYEWVFWHYDGAINAQYIPEHPDLDIFEKTIIEVKNYHDDISKVKRAGWVAISIEKAYRINLKANYTEAISKNLPAVIMECHGKFPFITRMLDIRYYGPRQGQHEYYYVMGLMSGDIIEYPQDDGKVLIEHINGMFFVTDMNGNTRFDTTSNVIPALPPENGDTLVRVMEEIELNQKG